jgi:hypothetical protein
MKIDERSPGRTVMPSRLLLGILVGTVALTAVVVTAGVGMVAFLGERGDAATWKRWSEVGQAFGVVNSVVAALAVAALVLTSLAQSRGQRDQQTDISVRHLHIALIRMAIDNPHLAAVWPHTTLKDPTTQAQVMYANLLLQHAWLQYSTGIATREEMVSNIRFLFASPKVRAFWESTASGRKGIYVDGGSEADLASVADEIWREYQAVLACSGGEDPETADDRVTGG